VLVMLRFLVPVTLLLWSWVPVKLLQPWAWVMLQPWL
jgi:hypothetical protein